MLQIIKQIRFCLTRFLKVPISFYYQRIRLEEETGKSQAKSDEENEIEEELEGASSSLNLSELDRLPHLTPITSTSIEVKEKSAPSANKQSISFEIPIHDEPEEKNVQPVQPMSKEKTFVKESTPNKKQSGKNQNTSDEDMVVLSFSSNPSMLSLLYLLWLLLGLYGWLSSWSSV